MHVYCLTRGIKHDVDRFITELQGKYLPYEFEKGKQGLVQFSVRPIQLWEMVFPEPALPNVMTTLFSDGNVRKSESEFSYAGRNDKYLWAMRKLLNSKPFPKFDPKAIPLPLYKKNIEIAGIGIKKDSYVNGVEQL